MEAVKIVSQQELRARIEALERIELVQRKQISNQINDVYEIIQNPVQLIRKSVKDLADDKEFRNDLILAGINIAGQYLQKKFANSSFSGIINLLIDKIRGSKNS